MLGLILAVGVSRTLFLKETPSFLALKLSAVFRRLILRVGGWRTSDKISRDLHSLMLPIPDLSHLSQSYRRSSSILCPLIFFASWKVFSYCQTTSLPVVKVLGLRMLFQQFSMNWIQSVLDYGREA